MKQAIVNLTLPIVTDKIDDILAAYPLYEYRQVYAVPELRQKLTAYVLARLPVVYVTMDSSAACEMTSTGHCYSSEQHAQIHQLIHQGIDALLGRPEVWQRCQGRERVETEPVPSSWFG
ncbi:late competence development ComFB family protein [Leptolyngbya sp. KIOST-1]|uniref:late competence development ComFB family protein n=1 Tax=Leptolyngbya sp. KIOST-1 TaxID=1229172 RepID=UPI00068F2445|nr:late competence development ComFB family protein [Leptolyngbya sp. KIOST-1]